MSPTPADLDRLLEAPSIPSIDFQPLLFRAGQFKEKKELLSLLETHPGTQVVDTITSQLSDLIKSRNPSRRLSPGELAQLAREHIGEMSWMEYGVWVYYKWSHRLVHLLDELEFAELRTNRNCYKITSAEQTRLSRARVGIVGLSAGQAIALTLALERSFGELRLADFDSLDLSNLNRIRSGVHNLGLNKAILTAREIAEIDPFLKVKVFSGGVAEESVDQFLLEAGKLDVLIDECDSIDVKFLLRERARKLLIPVVMQTSDRCQCDIERFDLEPARPLFHGLVGDLDYRSLRGLSNADKVPSILKILGPETISRRLKASLIEIEQTISTWPQLASAIVIGGGVAAEVCRRIYLNQCRSSGRYYLDAEALIPGAPVSCPTPQFEPVPASEWDDWAEIAQHLPKNSNGHRIPKATIEQLVLAGNAAPSGGNSQPWRWAYEAGMLNLLLHHQRSGSFLDFQNCASLVALGAAAENVILEAHRLGVDVEVQPFPVPAATALVARFSFSERSGFRRSVPDPDDHLAEAIFARHTNRRLGTRQPLPPDTTQTLRAAVERIPGARLQLLDQAQDLAKIAEILGFAERLRMLHQQCHRDLMSEIRWTKAEAERTRDGIDLETLDLKPTDRVALEVCRDWQTLELVRDWGGGKALEEMTRDSIRGTTAVALLTMPDHQPRDYFWGGRAAERIWLTAHQLGIALQPHSALIYLFARMIRGKDEGLTGNLVVELRRIRNEFREVFDVSDATGEILLFRLAMIEPPAACSLRRSVAETLSIFEEPSHGT